MLKTLWITCLFVFSLIPIAHAALPLKDKPKLVIVISVDQFRTDYLTRFEHQFTGGFKTLLQKGAFYSQAQSTIAFNVTGLGHAALLTGANPYLHGIVSHMTYDRTAGRAFYCVHDADAPLVSVDPSKKPPSELGTGRSPKALLVTTVGDEMKNTWGGKPVIASVAIKDRAAILMGGHRPDLAIWFNDSIGSWISSTYYVKDGSFPEWLKKWNAYDYMTNRGPKEWKPLLNESEYWLSTPHADEMVSDGKGMGKQFPHAIKSLKSFTISPWGSSYVLDTAIETIKGMKLGTHDAPDLLTIGLSSFDSLGHNFGPLTKELQDATLRLDRDLGTFLNQVNKLVPGGLAQTLIVLTADHGVQVTPMQARSLRLPGGNYYPKELLEKLEPLLKSKFGFSKSPVVQLAETNLYLDYDMLKDKGKSVTEVGEFIVNWLRTLPWVAAAYTKSDLLNGRISPNEISKKMAVTTHSERSGDVVFAARPGYLEDVGEYGGRGTDHETANVQEASIPIILMGSRIQSGRYQQRVHHIDLAPTLSALLGTISPSGSEGEVLTSCLKK